MSISAEKVLSIEMLSQNLDLVLRVLPEDALEKQRDSSDDIPMTRHTSVSTLGGSESQAPLVEEDCGESAQMTAVLGDSRDEVIGSGSHDEVSTSIRDFQIQC